MRGTGEAFPTHILRYLLGSISFLRLAEANSVTIDFFSSLQVSRRYYVSFLSMEYCTNQLSIFFTYWCLVHGSPPPHQSLLTRTRSRRSVRTSRAPFLLRSQSSTFCHTGNILKTCIQRRGVLKAIAHRRLQYYIGSAGSATRIPAWYCVLSQ